MVTVSTVGPHLGGFAECRAPGECGVERVVTFTNDIPAFSRGMIHRSTTSPGIKRDLPPTGTGLRCPELVSLPQLEGFTIGCCGFSPSLYAAFYLCTLSA